MVMATVLVVLGDLRTQAVPAVAILVVWGAAVLAAHPRGGRPRTVLMFALLLRGIVLFSPATLSDDLYRYLWEGHATLSGINPYRDAPSMMQGLNDAILAKVNHPTISSVYPPGAMWLFTAMAFICYDPIAVKVTMGLLDAGVAWGLAWVLVGRRRALSGAWLYALHPLAVVESAGSGHLEPAALLCMVMAIGAWDRGRSAVIWAGVGGLVKLLPFALMPALWRRNPWHMGVVVLLAVLCAAPFWDAGWALGTGLETYARHWSFNASVFAVFSYFLGSVARPFAMVLGAAISAWALWRHADPARVALWIGGAFVLLSPTVHPWYIAWAWVPALLCGVRAWSVLATLAPLSYVVLATLDPTTGQWAEPWWPVWVQYVPFLGVMAWEFGVHLTQPGPWAPGPHREMLSSPSPMAHVP